MKVISCNVQGRVKRTLEWQLERLVKQGADVVALQEITPKTIADWRAGLKQAGYCVIDTAALAAEPYPKRPYPSNVFPVRDGGKTSIQRKNFNLIASREPIERIAGLSFPDARERKFSFPEKYLAGQTKVGRRTVEIHNAHLPPGVSRGVVKVHAFEAIRRRVDKGPRVPKVLCGDFNIPLGEDDEGPLPSGRASRDDPRVYGKSWSKEIDARWAAGEAGILENPKLRDAYREVHKPGRKFPVSHTTRGGDRRYDYIFVSRHFTIESCLYLRKWLKRDESGWRPSDHAPVEATLQFA